MADVYFNEACIIFLFKLLSFPVYLFSSKTAHLTAQVLNSYPTSNLQIVLYHKNEQEGSGRWDSREDTLFIRLTKLAENIKIYLKIPAIFMQTTMQLQKHMYNTHNICAGIICSRC